MSGVWIGVGMMFVTVFLLWVYTSGSSDAGDGSREQEAWALIDHGALLVDTRSQAEWDQGHLDGAILIPHDQAEARLTEFGDDKSRPIVLYCRSGGRAGKVESLLRENGYERVFNAGGYQAMSDWRAEQSGGH